MKKIALLLVLAITAVVAVGCSRTTSNVYVLSTSDCGANWEKLSVGQAVPNHTGEPCGYNTAVPNWPMAGETQFKTQFDKGVLSSAHLTYSYAITDPIAFVNEARYLGKMGGSLEISAEDVGSRYEMAENIIIDKMLREVATTITRTMDVVDANPADIEDAIFKQAKDALDKKGVLINDLALVIENGEQTQLAIDSATAIRVYEAAGLKELGQRVIAAKAGATQITVNSSPASDGK